MMVGRLRRYACLAVVVLALGAGRAGALTPTEMAAFRHTTSDVGAVASAMMSWVTDQVSRPERMAGVGTDYAATDDVDVGAYTPITRQDLAAILVPQYIAAIPDLDGWGHPYDYYFSGNISQAHLALIRSAGADGSFDASVYARGEIASLDEDVVWADGYFVRGAGSALRDLRQKQVHLRSTVQNVGQAMMSWLTDQISMPSEMPRAGATGSAPSSFDLDLYPPMTAGELSSASFRSTSPRCRRPTIGVSPSTTTSTADRAGPRT